MCTITFFGWNGLMEIGDVNGAVEYFNWKLYDIFVRFAPKSKHKNSTYLRWLTLEILNGIKTKNKMYTFHK